MSVSHDDLSEISKKEADDSFQKHKKAKALGTS